MEKKPIVIKKRPFVCWIFGGYDAMVLRPSVIYTKNESIRAEFIKEMRWLAILSRSRSFEREELFLHELKHVIQFDREGFWGHTWNVIKSLVKKYKNRPHEIEAIAFGDRWFRKGRIDIRAQLDEIDPSILPRIRDGIDKMV